MRNFIDIIVESQSPRIGDMSRFAAMSPDSLRDMTREYDDGYGATTFPAACRSSDDYEWSYDAAYPLDRLEHHGKYGPMLTQRKDEWAQDGDPTYYDELFDIPLYAPIILVEIDGVGYVWDGAHRVGAFELMDGHTIPAVVGRPVR